MLSSHGLLTPCLSSKGRQESLSCGHGIKISYIFIACTIRASTIYNQPGIDGSPDPLQDNGIIVMKKLATKVFNVDALCKS